MLGPLLQIGSNSFLASNDSPACQRFQELARIAGVARAFTLSAKLRLYTLLRDVQEKEGLPGLTWQQVAERLGLISDPGFRGVMDWLDLLTSLSTLQRAGVGPEAVYSNTPDADKYLSKQSPDYMGGHAILNHDRTFPQSVWLEDVLRGNKLPDIARQVVAPVLETFAGDADTAAVTGGDPVAFTLGMTGCNKPAFTALATKFDFSPYKTLADFGGSAGTLCCCVAAAQLHMTCTTLDLPAVHEAAVTYVRQQGLTERVKVADVDFFDDSAFPGSDVITMGMILHDWGLQKKLLLMRKAYAALPPGGAFIAIEVLIDDERQANVWGLNMSLDMLAEFEEENAFDFTFSDFTGWARQCGFSRTELIRLVGPNSAAVAYK